MVLDLKKAKEELLAGRLEDCQQFFVKNGCMLENAYARLLCDDIEGAKVLFSLIKERDIRAHWALFMISLIEGDAQEYPSYFELRNFLEIDLNILITYYKGDFVEKIIRYADYMYTINPEVYKFIGRVLYNNGLVEQGLFFLNRAKSYFYHDPELHFMLGDIYFSQGKFDDAQNALENGLRVLPEYFPSENLLKKVIEIKNNL